MPRNPLLRTVAITLLALFVVVAASGAVDAAKKKNRKGGKGDNKAKIQRAIAANKRSAERAKAIGAGAAQTAQAAGYKAYVHREQVETAQAHVALLRDHADEAAARLQQIEQSIIDAQEEDSPLREALQDVARAQEAYQQVRTKIFNSAAYKAAYQRALASSDKEVQLPAVRRVFVEESRELQLAEAHLRASQERLEQARSEIFSADEQWTDTAAEVRSSKAELAAAELALRNGLLGKTAAESIQRNAASLAQQAAQAARQNAARIKQLQAQQKKNNNRGNKSGSKSKR